MTIQTILGHAILLMGFMVLAVARPGSRRRSRERQRTAAGESPPTQPGGVTGSLAGVPLRILLSERLGPGALLRDTLMTRPSTRDE